MKKTILSMAFVWTVGLATAATAAERVPDHIPGTTKITAEDLIALVQKHPDLVIVDARKRSDYEKGHIEGAVSLPDTETTPDTLSRVVPSKETPVVFYCNGVKCGRSVTSARRAVAWGYSKVYWFRGGWEEWTAKGYPVSK